jgi:multidrug efflux system outer membrane protein
VEKVTKLLPVGAALGAGAALLVLAGCAAGPDYREPKITVPARFDGTTAGQYSTNAPLLRWWGTFSDPYLTNLVAIALTNNLDLRVAEANIREARALRREAQFDFLPVVNASGGYREGLLSEATAPGLSRGERRTGLFDAGFDALWELDLFGRVRRSVEARTAQTEAAMAALENFYVTLTSEIARNYFELRGLQNELGVALKNAENQKQTLAITQARLEGGRGTELDVARARAQWTATLALIPPLQSGISAAIHRLSVLTGQQPNALKAALEKESPLPPLPSLVNIGNPEELLRRRPDIRVAERNLAAATAGIGIVTADLFPRVTFNGNIALESSSFTGLGAAGSETWSFGPRISWAALDYGHVRARIRAAGARADASLAQYEQTVLSALEETENALVDFGREQERMSYLQQTVESSRSASQLAQQRFDAGAVDFLVVLDAERALLDAEDQLARSQTRTLTSLVSVYKALGGSI